MTTSEGNSTIPVQLERGETLLLLAAVFITSICGLAYELLIGATGAFIAGDGVKQFAFTIGIFLSSMGLGSYLSRKVPSSQALQVFISSELLIGLLGGISHPVLYLLYAYSSSFSAAFYAFLIIIGSLTGLEIPLVTRVLAKSSPLKLNISNVLSLDYLGALITTVMFPLILLPTLGLWYTSVMFGLLNTILAGIILFTFRRASWFRKIIPAFLITCFVLLILAIGGKEFMAGADNRIYADEIIFSKQSSYQKIVLTRWQNDLRLFLNGNIQFSSLDEYRYHEALVHPAMSGVPCRERVLILGGGDGLAAREVFRYKDVKHVDLVDLDPEVVKLAKSNSQISKLNENSLKDPRLHYHATDAWLFVRNIKHKYNIIIVDLPDPSSENLVKLYSKQFYEGLKHHLAADGAISVQATSPYFNKQSFWCIIKTMKGAGLKVSPFRAQVPSFGEWGFALGTKFNFDPGKVKLKVKTRYLSNEIMKYLSVFPKDLVEIDVTISTLDHPVILKYYLDDYGTYFK